MNPQTDPLYAGLVGVEIDVDSFDLGQGITISQTYGHFMAPFLMAFAPAKAGETHPAPWSAVEGGLGIDFHVQLHVPAAFEIAGFFDRLNTVWWIAALIRLRGSYIAHVPVLAAKAFAAIPQEWSTASILPLEVFPRRLFTAPKLTKWTVNDLVWLRETWREGGMLMCKSSVLSDVFQAFDSSGNLPNKSIAMLTIWGALEHLFSPAKQELRFRVSANIASFLEPPGPTRLKLHRKLLKLYDSRSQVAHGTPRGCAGAWGETHEVASRVLLKVLEGQTVPSKESMDAALFAP